MIPPPTATTIFLEKCFSPVLVSITNTSSFFVMKFTFVFKQTVGLKVKPCSIRFSITLWAGVGGKPPISQMIFSG